MEHWRVTESEHGIVIVCFGHDRSWAWERAVELFGTLISRRASETQVVADLSEMTGYETEARRAWQQAFAKHRRSIRRAVFVGAPSRGIRMGAAVVGAVSGVPVRFVDAWSDLEKLEE
jgi:hypothetical protein